jgi:hypothetical protein
MTSALLMLILFASAPDEGDELPEVTVGRRLFLETGFAQFFWANSKGRLNEPLAAGDPVMARSSGTAKDLAGPFSGRSMNCRACHLVNEHQREPGAGVRTYTDFARHSPIPARDDGQTHTPRRSPILVNSTVARSVPVLLHDDGEFASIEDLVRGTLTGRNFGWREGETEIAVRHIARVLREDDGFRCLRRQTAGLSYAALLKGGGPPFVRVPEEFRLDVGRPPMGRCSARSRS